MIVDTVFPVPGIECTVRRNITGCGLECLLPVIGTGTPTPAHHHCREFLQAPCTAQHGRKAVSLRIPCFCIIQIQQQFYMKTVPLRKDMRTEYRSSARPCFRSQQYPNQASYYIFHPFHSFTLSFFNSFIPSFLAYPSPPPSVQSDAFICVTTIVRPMVTSRSNSCSVFSSRLTGSLRKKSCRSISFIILSSPR